MNKLNKHHWNKFTACRRFCQEFTSEFYTFFSAESTAMEATADKCPPKKASEKGNVSWDSEAIGRDGSALLQRGRKRDGLVRHFLSGEQRKDPFRSAASNRIHWLSD